MNALLDTPTLAAPESMTRCASVRAHVDAACGRIAPSWPLDRSIAVNPWWGFVDRPIATAAAELAASAGARTLMPRAYFRQAFEQRRFERGHVARAIAAAGADTTADAVIERLTAAEARCIAKLPLVADLADAGRDLRVAPAWRDFVTHQTSQHCAAYFDRWQATWSARPASHHDASLYATWRRQVVHEHASRLLFGDRSFTARARRLPETPLAMIEHALRAFDLPEAAWTDYCAALLFDLNGWAGWCAYLRWQARLGGADDTHVIDLLAMRIAWEWLLFEREPAPAWLPGWRADWAGYRSRVAAVEYAERDGWLLQAALECAYQDALCAGLRTPPSARRVPTPNVQAVFCIDVRSERMRRALEAVAADVATRGFAGFFGLPIAFRPLGACEQRPQLPGLLAPALCASECGSADSMADASSRRPAALAWRERWHRWRTGASSAFTFVESLGLWYAGKLFERTFVRARDDADARLGLSGMQARSLRPSLLGDEAIEVAQLCDLVAGALTAMGLTRDFAPLVLLVGHGSRSANNPFAASLDCGACGGATGEVNARVLAELLNDARIRAGLADRGIAIPATTHVVAALHDTTTDEIVLYDRGDVPVSHEADIERLTRRLREAGDRVRAERAPSLGLDRSLPANTLLDRLRRRANDWAEVRPEWGLANNAAFVVAPRARTRTLDLDGRVFLHDYDCRLDPTGATLESIMTAPMVVAHWINMQYYASTVDNARFGSGNKVLHNVVGGSIGVFEGNGGDLRVGLPLQSLHDGATWRHTPLRLSVFVEAPQAAIDAVIAKYDVVRNLVEHGWLHLFRIEPDGTQIQRRARGAWHGVATATGGD